MSCHYEKNHSRAVRSRHPILLRSLMIVAILWGAGTSLALAQNSERTAGELERTDQKIDKARQAVEESGSDRGRMLLENAIELQQMARNRFRGRMFQQAQSLTLRAREKASEAIAATRSTEENEDAVRRQLERTDDVLQKIRERSGLRRGPGDANELRAGGRAWESLSRRQRAAWQNFHERRPRYALRLTLQVREQAMRQTEGARRRHGWEDARQSLERLHVFVDRARDPIRESRREKNMELFERAERRLGQAEEALQAGQMSVAQEHIRICRQLLNRALIGIDLVTNRADVEQLIDETRLRWERLEGAVIDSGDRRVRDMYRRAGDELQRARSMVQEERMNEALMHTRATVRIINEIEKVIPEIN